MSKLSHQLLHPILAALLDYPQPALIEALPEIDARVSADPDTHAALAPLLTWLGSTDLITLQETFVATFDRTPGHSLHLFEHIHGESRDRGQAMVDLLQEYQRHGLTPHESELPDHVPTFLEFLGTVDAGHAQALLGDAIHVLAAIGVRLARHDNPYASVFTVLRTMTPVEPREQDDPPVRDMDEAMEVFGVGADGVEPLLRPRVPSGPQTVHFHPRAAHAH